MRAGWVESFYGEACGYGQHEDHPSRACVYPDGLGWGFSVGDHKGWRPFRWWAMLAAERALEKGT